MAALRDRPTDPDFDPPRIAWPPEADLARCRRVVVNPFLALLGLGAWGGLMRQLARFDVPGLVVLGTALLALVPYLIQFHCLDCGGTGPLPGYRHHACPGLVARWRQRQWGRFRWPRPTLQLLLWGLLLVGLAAGFAVLVAVRRR